MPGISDPGSDLVDACVRQGIPVVVVPGPCAAITALAGSGLPTDRFVFEGFLPIASKLRKVRLASLADETRTTILYEAPHRIKRTLADLAAIPELADRRLTLGRELTKAYEEYIRSTVTEASRIYQQTEPRGEFVLILEGSIAWKERTHVASGSSPVADHGTLPLSGIDPDGHPESEADPAIAMLRAQLREGKSLKDAVRQCARKTGRGRNELYPLALALTKDSTIDAVKDSAKDAVKTAVKTVVKDAAKDAAKDAVKDAVKDAATDTERVSTWDTPTAPGGNAR
jgi:16S rRNA C1402 (ribose-2'-O) methylase RsmI